MSDKILVGLIFFYVIAFAVALAQNKYGLAVYWLGAGNYQDLIHAENVFVLLHILLEKESWINYGYPQKSLYTLQVQ